MSYELIVERRARKAISLLPDTVYDCVARTIENPTEDPRPRSSRKLQGREGYRLRVGDYRTLYAIDDARREIFVAEVWHRQRDYR